MNKEERNHFKSTLKVIQGELPSVKQMKKELPQLFQELKNRLSNVIEIGWQPLSEIEKFVSFCEFEYGINIKKIYLVSNCEIREIYKKTKKYLKTVKDAEIIKKNEKQAKRRNFSIAK